MHVHNLEQTASPNGRNSKLQMTVTAVSFLFPKTQRKTGERGEKNLRKPNAWSLSEDGAPIRPHVLQQEF